MNMFVNSDKLEVADLLWEPQRIRWFSLLYTLENYGSISLSLFAKQHTVSQRILEKDLELLRKYFDQSIRLIKESDDLVLELRNPLRFYGKKQDLLEQEPLLRILHQLFLGGLRTRREWEAYLQVSPATFYHQRKKLNQILQPFSLQVDSQDLRLVGPEQSIRTFFYQLYFTLDSYPSWMEATRQTIYAQMGDSRLVSSDWPIDFRVFFSWQGVVKQRLRLGSGLPEKSEWTDQYEQLSQMLWLKNPYHLPIQESSFLFLVSIKEVLQEKIQLQEQFANKFISDTWKQELLAYGRQAFGSETLAMIGTLGFAFLYESFFESTDDPKTEHNVSDLQRKKLSFTGEQFVNRCLRLQEQHGEESKAILFDWQLEGTGILQEWIQEKVVTSIRHSSDIRVVQSWYSEELIDLRLVHVITITNHPIPLGKQKNISYQITTYPTEKEIETLCITIINQLKSLQ
ncbi:helix-turn-helix domain-containing protein [Enterococcus casseliflavus]|uniref:helix-turn-helix domain-containing protein n=1 Tax=Enterococcus casseliflavus TaxID=37734 RepID=UPI0022E43131|nr:helix-turn-helix domain-containing protein [Enterococcus casseliflavus]